MTAEPSDQHAPPQAAALIESLRALGYDLPDAIADLVDNSVTAEAVTVGIEYNADATGGWVAIVDDGRGMTEAQLHEAMHLGTHGPWVQRHPADLGRFGLGLKTASFSQARRLTVISRSSDGRTACREWDMDHVRRRNGWYLRDSLDEEAMSVVRQLNFRNHGTMVLWRNLDHCGTGSVLVNRMTKVRTHLGAVFGRHLSRGSLSLHVGGQPVTGWDPFLRDHAATQDMGTESIHSGSGVVTVTPFVLPHPSRILESASRNAAGSSGWIRHQGFYVYRRQRLITLGGWLGMPGLRQTHPTQLARISVDIGTEDDHSWQVDVRKAKVIPPAHLRDRLAEIATLARSRSEQVFRHRGSGGDRRGGRDRLVFVWQQHERRGRTGYRINREHPVVVAALADAPDAVRPLLRLIEETVPVGLIAADTSSSPERVPQAPLEAAEREEVALLLRAAVAKLPAQPTSREAFLQALKSTEPFNRFPDVLAEVLDSEGAPSS
ncbi:ATP-binding protein [Micromonospora sp. NPDC049275]|uniref:ATP-binding protein n=1 Tax=Micromonospora sp. NPDC049275 TaxID=3364268 RepID=UPI003712BD9B